MPEQLLALVLLGLLLKVSWARAEIALTIYARSARAFLQDIFIIDNE